MLKFLDKTKNFSIFFLKKLAWFGQRFCRNTVYMKKEGRIFIIFA